MCACNDGKFSRRGLLKGVGVGVAALLVHATGQAPVAAQTESPLPTAQTERQVVLPPLPPTLNEAEIVREVVELDAHQDNGYTPESSEATPERKAELEARDRYLATLAPNAQGDINQIGVNE